MGVDNRPRRRENCPFYPSCYIAGDCDENDWQKQNCGLETDEKEKERQKFLDGLAKNKVRLKAIRMAESGMFDHLVESADERG